MLQLLYHQENTDYRMHLPARAGNPERTLDCPNGRNYIRSHRAGTLVTGVLPGLVPQASAAQALEKPKI
jgi:hypothetical protein